MFDLDVCWYIDYFPSIWIGKLILWVSWIKPTWYFWMWIVRYLTRWYCDCIWPRDYRPIECPSVPLWVVTLHVNPLRCALWVTPFLVATMFFIRLKPNFQNRFVRSVEQQIFHINEYGIVFIDVLSLFCLPWHAMFVCRLLLMSAWAWEWGRLCAYLHRWTMWLVLDYVFYVSFGY